ncbi:hypothetical protein [Desulfoscipio geothermicus]|nr:hypothetical protein [Desulfoscipio geothermicus]
MVKLYHLIKQIINHQTASTQQISASIQELTASVNKIKQVLR